MSVRIPPRRRACIAALGCVLAATVCRGQIATALLLRGDEFLYRGNDADALRYYGRAITLDPRLASAADRYAFVAMQTHNRRALDDAIRTLDRAIAAGSGDVALIADRALCLHLERRYAPARRDFIAAARESRDPRYFTFAGWDAYALDDKRAAHALWRRALSLSPRFLPARRALERTQ